MGKFANKVRCSQVRQPIQHGFSREKWIKAYSSITEPDLTDKHLHKAGLWYDAMLESIRNELRKYSLSDLEQNEQLRLIVAYINFGYNSLQYAKAKAIPDKETLHIEDLVQTKFDINGGSDAATGNDIITQNLDSARHPLSAAIKGHIPPSSTSDNESFIKNLEGAMGLGQIYDVIADCWGETLWNDWQLKKKNDTTIITPPSSNEAIAHAVSGLRIQLLQMQESLWIHHYWQHSLSETEKSLIGRHFEVVIQRKGKRKYYQLRKTSPTKSIPKTRILFRMMTEETYFQGFRHDPIEKAGGVNLEQLLDIWDILYEICMAFTPKLPTVKEISKLNTLKSFAPLVERKALIDLIIRNVDGVSQTMCEQVINFLSFQGSKSDELWSAPIVSVDSKQLALVFPAITISNWHRNCETWLKKADVDLTQKGPAFEKHVRDSISEALCESSIIINYGIFPKGLIFEAKCIQEEIDCVFWIGSTILIGEVKCLHLPTEPIERHNYYKTLDHAVSQIKRKTAFIEENIDLFLTKLSLQQSPKRIIPFILCNQPLGVGFARDGVPITDIPSLTCYLNWCGIKKGVFSKRVTGILDDVPEVRFYKTEEEAELKVYNYLLQPPQIKKYADSVEPSLHEWPIRDPYGHKTAILRADVNYDAEQQLS